MSRLNTAGSLALLASLVACSEPEPAESPPKAVRAVTATTLTGTVGTAVPGGVSVRVVDYADRPKPDIKVGFSILAGDGAVTKRLVVTDAEGIAHTDWTLGQTAGANQLYASVFGVDSDSNATFVAIGSPAAAAGLSITPRILRIPSTADGGAIVGRVVDQYGNVVGGAPSYTSRDDAVVTVSGTGQVTVTGNNRGTSTWIIVEAAGFTDSAHVFNLSSTDPPCTGITAMAPLAVGEVQVTGFVDNGVCIPAADGDREYALVPFFDSPVPTAQTSFTVSGFGIRGTAGASLGAVRARDAIGAAAAAASLRAGVALDSRLRLAESREMRRRALGARKWYASRAAVGRRATRATFVPSVGDEMEINVNANDFCSAPSMRTGRVVAVTNRAVVVADKANPAGFSDADYASFGASFDTLIYVSNAANFGAPTDVDENGNRVVLFFTHAVNEMGFGVLGFAYSRDLLPELGPLGSCPGSNVAELLYLRVPNAGLPVSQARFDVLATLAHEFQHVINSGRRLYVNVNAAPAEERWLNEGLSHVAEDLLFFRSSGLAPRQNLGAQLTQAQSAFSQFLSRNFSRYWQFTRHPGSQSPMGLTDDDDDLETRGATWSYLRFAADHRHAANQTAFWQALVNSNSTGIQNLYEQIGADARLLVRDWAISNFMDDLVPTDPKYTQPSWNLRVVPGFVSPAVFHMLSPGQGTTNTTSTVTLFALGSEFVRFGVGSNQEAYVVAGGFPANTNTPLPRNVVLAIVRTK